MRFIGVALGPPIFAYLMDKGDSIVLFSRPFAVSFHYFGPLFIQPDEEDESEQLKTV